MESVLGIRSGSTQKSTKVAPPVRILVQTVTGLVPGDLYPERVRLMRNLICQYFWDRDFDFGQERCHIRTAEFGFDDRVCYFLLDSGINITTTEEPPVLWYRWTGDSFVAINKVLPTGILDRLQEYPFRKEVPKGPNKLPVEPDKAEKRRMIQARLHCNKSISESVIEFLREHPDEAMKLKNDLEPRFWSKLDTFAKSREGGYRAILPRNRGRRKPHK